MNRSSRDAREAIADVVNRMEGYRMQVAVLRARAQRSPGEAERMALREECSALGAKVQAARIELLEKLMDAPPAVMGHSRVFDVERALDNLEAALAEALKAI